MEMKKKCAVCGYEFLYSDKIFESPFISPNDEGAKYYYDLWHYNVESCPNCGYSSKDVSKNKYKGIVNDESFKNVSENEILKELDAARPNRISQYIKAGLYYLSIAEDYMAIVSNLLAGDLVYAELMYWDEYIFDNNDSITALINQRKYNEIKEFADSLFNKALDDLDKYIKDNPYDYDAQLLYAGSLGDGDRLQAMKGLKILNTLKTANLNTSQKLTLAFLLKEVN